jgi:RimJ/RimL family protein N-acetyltransferase
VLLAAILDQPAALAAKIEALAADGARRAAMSHAAAAMTDGRGAQRLLAAVVGCTRTAGGGEIALRLAETSDSDWLLELQRMPQTRRFARQATVPSAAEHTRWMEATLANPDRLLMIVVSGENQLGMLRLDRVHGDPPAYEISIAINPVWHRHGIGLATLTLARQLAPGADLLATVLSGNEASVALFEAAGYRFESPERLRSRAA